MKHKMTLILRTERGTDQPCTALLLDVAYVEFFDDRIEFRFPHEDSEVGEIPLVYGTSDWRYAGRDWAFAVVFPGDPADHLDNDFAQCTILRNSFAEI